MKSLYTQFQWYPETAGKALLVAVTLSQKLSPEDIDYFSQPAFVKHVDPVVLAMAMVRSEASEKACTLMTEALKKTPNDPRLNYYASTVFYARLNSEWAAGKTAEEIQAERVRVATHLAKAARRGYEKARKEQENLVSKGNKFAIIAQCGNSLANTKEPEEFYKAIRDLAMIAVVNEKNLSQGALRVLVNRASNAGCMYLHPNSGDVELLEKQRQMISDGRLEELTEVELCLWGVRYLYGVEGIGQDLNLARYLLRLAKEQGSVEAAVHRRVEQLVSNQVTPVR